MERNWDLKRSSMQSSEAVLHSISSDSYDDKLETLLWRWSSRTMIWTVQNQHHTPWTTSDQIFESKLSRNSTRRGVSRWGTHLAFGHPPLLGQYYIRTVRVPCTTPWSEHVYTCVQYTRPSRSQTARSEAIVKAWHMTVGMPMSNERASLHRCAQTGADASRRATRATRSKIYMYDVDLPPVFGHPDSAEISREPGARPEGAVIYVKYRILRLPS